jgi:hypothetical protein
MKTKKTITKLMTSAVMTASAFAPSFAQNNLGADCGCPSVSSRSTVVNLSTLTTQVNGLRVFSNPSTVLTCDKMYILDAQIHVDSLAAVTIQPGVVIKAKTIAASLDGTAPALVVQRGGKIFATGTESCPVVFTAEADPMDNTYGITNKGQWGGVVVLGKAKNNLDATTNVGSGKLGTGVAGVGFIEGFPAVNERNKFGMPVGQEDDNDNSGIMTYVSIRHGGAIVGANNELNGLTLGSVGRGTTIHHIEVVSNLDDGIEFFGGTVDLKYGSVLFNDDDAFDWDLGWSGRGQFWTAVKTDQTTASGGDNGFESDGDDNKINAAYQSNPTVYNCTFIGSNNINGVATQKGVGAMLKEQTQGTIKNSVIANYQVGVDIKNDNTRPADDVYENWINGTLKFECNTLVGNTSQFRINNATPSQSDSTKFITTDKNVLTASVVGFSPLHTMNVSTNAVTVKLDATPNPALATTCTPPTDGFFTTTNYRGAFEANKKSWLSNYTIEALKDMTSGLVPCPTDINVDGSTNNTDFLQLLGNFNSSCD